jgi:hypothetical protein
MYDIRMTGREGQITCTTLPELNPGTPCVATIDGSAGKVTFRAEWGSGVATVTTRSGTLTVATLTWEEVKALEEALGLLAHVATRP